MSNEKEYEELYRLARKKVEERTFYIHFVIFIIFNTILILIWRFTGVSFPWFVFPLGLWGMLVVFHYFANTYVSTRKKPSGNMERAIQFEVWKMKQAQRQKEARILETKEGEREGKTTEENDKPGKSDTDKTS